MVVVKNKLAGAALVAASTVFAGCATAPAVEENVADAAEAKMADEAQRQARTFAFVACVDARRILFSKELQVNPSVARAARNPDFMQYVVSQTRLNCFSEVTEIPREKLLEESQGNLSILLERYLHKNLFDVLAPQL